MGWTECRRSHSTDAIDQTTRQQRVARGTYLVLTTLWYPQITAQIVSHPQINNLRTTQWIHLLLLLLDPLRLAA